MTQIAGVDGCPGGWLCITLDSETDAVTANIFPTARQLLAFNPHIEAMAIDMPIGLPHSGRRRCDKLAKNALGNRHVCVFYAPTRDALSSPSRIAASTILGRGATVQEWEIYSKINNLDLALTSSHQRWCFEVHPEICFWAWNDATAMEHKKSSAEGRQAREQLIDAHWPHHRANVLQELSGNEQIATNHYADDDVNDAFACLWTAQRLIAQNAERMPPDPDVDVRGLRMEIWY